MRARSAASQDAPAAKTARPVPAITGEQAAGRVRGRAPASHCAAVGRAAVGPRAAIGPVTLSPVAHRVPS